jgi:hypothetical protein
VSLGATAFDQDGNRAPGGCYIAIGPDGATAAACDDDGDGAVDFGGQPAGDWTVVETSPPPGHDPAQPVEQDVRVESEQRAEAGFGNVRIDPAAAVIPPPFPEPVRVAAIGDFQDELGCGADFDAGCAATDLARNRGTWSGTFVLPPGVYSLRIFTQGDVDRSLGVGGIEQAPDLRFAVPAGAAAVVVTYDEASGAISARPAAARVQVASGAGTVDLNPIEGGGYEGYFDAPAGSEGFQVLVDGQAVHSDGTPFEFDARLHIVTDAGGNPVTLEFVEPASLTATRIDLNGNLATGSCIAVLTLGGSLVGRACETGGTGEVVMAFPNGIEPGEYLVREFVTPEGLTPAPDQVVTLGPGSNNITVGP